MYSRSRDGPRGSLPIPNRRSVLARASAAENGGNGLEQDLEVQSQRPVVDVLQVQLPPLLEVDGVAPRDLPEAGEARPDAEAPARPELVLLDFGRDGRTGADEAHVPLEDVPHLGELVEAELPEEAADLRHAGIILDLEHRAVHLVQVL